MGGAIFATSVVTDPARIDPSAITSLIGVAIFVVGFGLLAWWARHRADP
jgi:hypothetical protein